MADEQFSKRQVKEARSKFIAMASTYCLGVFNDNYFKQAALLLAVTSGMAHLQGTATVLFSLPFILCSSYAGWVADRFAKKNVVVASKGLECTAMLIGAAGIMFSNWPCILAMVFLMGLQSTFFSPALNGSIPELYPASYVARANGILKLVTTLSILAGIALAGITLDATWFENYQLTGVSMVAIFVVLTAFLGFFISFGAYSKPATGVVKPFPKFGPISSLKDVYEICRDRQLLIAIFADTYFYFIASVAVLAINVLGLQQLGLSQTITSLLSVCLMLGICAGSLVVARVIKMENWSRFLVVASFGMALGLFFASATVYLPVSVQTGWLIFSLIFVGFCGGFFLIPITSFLQVHPERSEKGRVLATTNFCGFVGIMCSGFVFSALDSFMSPASVMATIGVLSLLTTVVIAVLKNNPRKLCIRIFSAVFRMVLSLRYSVKIVGMDKIKVDDSRGTLFLPNHPALIDPVLVMINLYSKFYPRPLSDSGQANMPVVRQVMKVINPITIPDIGTDGRSSRDKVKAAMQEVVECIQKGEDIILYPAGRVYRTQHENLAGNSGVEYVLNNAPDTRVVLVRTSGLWGSSYGRANNSSPSILKSIPHGIKYVLANLLFLGPRRKVTIELVEDSHVKTLTERKAINRYLEAFYNKAAQPNTVIPYYWWQGRSPQILPEPTQKKVSGSLAGIPDSVIDQVKEKVEELTGQQVKLEQKLSTDLGVDSLSLMELAAWLETEFGTSVEDLNAVDTVQDCVLAAAGKLSAGNGAETVKIAESWFKTDSGKLELPAGESLTSLFLTQAIKYPKKVILADQISGCKTYRDVLTAIFVLKPIIEKIPGDKVGLMMPASASSAIVYMATLFSGKIPVMYNWTVGVANMEHGIKETGTHCIITAKALCSRVKEQGTDLDKLDTEWLYLEEIAKQVSVGKKVMALSKAIFSPKSLAQLVVNKTAVILFTSGSEAKPKAVPLTHKNILTNLADFSKLISFKGSDSLLGMLPPFHSLGLTGTVVMPLCIGLRTVYHANPTESVVLAKLIDVYKATILIGTPTFMNGILQTATKEQLTSIRLMFTGAEKCPETVYNKLQQMNDSAVLCEGYGITECSPLVSLNTIEENMPGTIGKVVPSTEYVVVDLEENKAVQQGERGILLLRGDNIFSGYLGDTESKGFHQYDGKLWYQTGDFVREDEKGILTFSGRKKRFVKLGGEMISLPAIETVLLQGFANIESEGPALAIEAKEIEGGAEIVMFATFDATREDSNKVIRESGLSALHNVRRIIAVDEIPVLGTGKTDYKQLKEQLN